MRRLVYLLILVVAVGASATGVSASTDCERWFAAYRSQLAHTQQVQRLAAAKRRAKRYAQRKLAGYVKPHPAVHVPPGPRMPRHEALHKVELACGVLPENSADQPLLSEEQPPEFLPEQPLPDEGLLPGFDGPGTILPEEGPPPPVFSEAPPSLPGGGPPISTSPFIPPMGGSPSGGKTPPGGGGGTPPPGGGSGTPPPGGGSGTPPPGGGSGTPPPGGGGTPPPGGGGGDTPPPYVPPPDVTPVPEPGSIVLMLTGTIGAAGVIRRRFKAQ